MQRMRPFSSSSFLSPSTCTCGNIISVFSKFGSSLLDHGTARGSSADSAMQVSSFLPGKHHSATASALWNAQPSLFRKLIDPPKDGLPQTQFINKTTSQSRTNVVYNFSTDYLLREQYTDARGEVKIGNLLEDLDMVAATVAIKHCSVEDSGTRSPFVVTASMENMLLKKPITVASDMKIAGAVSWVGRSSLEVQVEVTQQEQEDQISQTKSDLVVLTGRFIFAARDSKTGNLVPVNGFTAITEREKLLLEEGDARNRARKKKKGEEVQRRESENHKGVHADLRGYQGLTFAECYNMETISASKGTNSPVPYPNTYLENSFICQPQHRNLYGRVFGGFLMHRAFELAFATAYNFAGQMPRLLQVDHVDFFKPVDVEDFLRLKSWVLFSEAADPTQTLIHVAVEARVTRPGMKTNEMSNRFYFTFTGSSAS